MQGLVVPVVERDAGVLVRRALAHDARQRRIADVLSHDNKGMTWLTPECFTDTRPYCDIGGVAPPQSRSLHDLPAGSGRARKREKAEKSSSSDDTALRRMKQAQFSSLSILAVDEWRPR